MSIEKHERSDDRAARLSRLSPAQRALLAERLRERGSDGADVGPPVLSFAQERTWLLSELSPGLAAYNTSRVVRLRGPVDVERLRTALSTVLERLDVLRTRVERSVEGGLNAVVGPVRPAVLEVADDADPDAALGRVEEFVARPFDLGREDLLRALLVRLDTEESLLALSVHHIASDEGSREPLWALIGEAYAGRTPPRPRQYSAFARAQRAALDAGGLAGATDWWRAHLAGAPTAVDLPVDHLPPAVQTFRGRRTSVVLEPTLAKALRDLAASHSTTLFVAATAAFCWLMSRWCRTEDLLVGMPVSGRDDPGSDGVVGLFVNTVVVRADCSGEPSYGELVRRVRESVIASVTRQEVPFEKVVEALAPPRDLARNPLFQIGVNSVNPRGDASFRLGDLWAEPVQVDPGLTKLDVGLLVRDAGDTGAELLLEYSAEIFEAATIRALADQLVRLLEAASSRPERALADLDAWPAGQQLLAARGPDVSDAEGCLHDAIAAQMVLTPDAVAVADESTSLTFAELDRRTSDLAHHLVDLGVGPGVLVAVGVPRSVDMEVAVLAALRAGGAYVPLDTTYPPERLAFMLADSAAEVLLTTRAGARELPGHPRTVLVDEPTWPSDRGPAPETGVTADDLCYVIYTSGSTGQPKGVELRHRGVVNRMAWMQRLFTLTGSDTVLQKTPLSFDVSAWEVLWPVMVGARLFLARPDGHRDPAYLAEVVTRERVTVMHFVPSMLAAFLDSPAAARLADSGLRIVVCSGEALPNEVKDRFLDLLPAVGLHNLYGPTEASVDVTWHHCRAGREHPVRIGRPMDNVTTLVLDERRRPVPVGIPGELYLAGVQLARGYLGRPDLTTERFVALDLVPGGRAYRTGDLVRWTADGEVDYLGRMDDQVKLRGFRIELGEVEAALTTDARVTAACATLVQLPSGEPALAAYLVVDGHGSGDSNGDADGAVDSALQAARARLPEYMVPTMVRVLPQLPLSPSGKLDRAALPTALPVRVRAAKPPRTETERRVLEVWRTLLGQDGFGVEDDFFSLGGHSLLAVRMLSAVARDLGVWLPVSVAFRTPTVAGIAAEVEEIRGTGSRSGLDPPDRRRRRRSSARLDDVSRLAEAVAGRGDPDPDADLTVVPLSPAQQRMWFLDALADHRPLYSVRRSFRVDGVLDVDRLRSALHDLARRHEALRTRVRARGEVLAGVVVDDAGWPLEVRDLSTEPDPVEAARTHAREVAGRPFDLERGPLAQAYWYVLGPDDGLLVLRLHHLLLDAWSVEVLIEELRILYATDADLGPVVQYPDVVLVEHEQEDEQAADLAYWRERMAGAPVSSELPTDRPRPAQPTSAGRRRSFDLGPELTNAIGTLAREHATTPYAVLLATWASLLSRLSGQDDVVIGSVVAGRHRPGVERTVGLFANTLPLRTDLSGNPRFVDILRQCRETLAGAQEHQALPFERLVEELAPERDLGRNPLFQVLLNLVPSRLEDVELGAARLAPFDLDSPFTRFDLGLTVTERPDGLTATAEYRTDLFDQGSVDQLLVRLEQVLRVVTAEPEVRLGEIALLTPGEEAQLLAWGGNPNRCPETTALDLVADQVRRNPDRTAVRCFGQDDLTYARLWHRSGVLACRIAERVVPGSTVAVLVGRHPGLLVAALAVWRAGCHYLPLDGSYPSERVAFMVEDSGAGLVLHDDDVRVTDDDVADRDGLDRLPGADAEGLAYLIYTSGSTGRPKGVAVEHRSLANLLLAMAEGLDLPAAVRWAAVTTFAFDIAALELFGPLVAGGEVVLLDRTTAADGRALGSALDDADAQVLQATPSTWRMLLAAGWAGRPGLVALSGGEPLTPDLAAQLLPRVASLWNCYGPTETTIWSTLGRVEDAAEVSIGTALLDTSTYVLDAGGRLCPPGSVGELWIGGGGVARGYHERPELTAERFRPDPWQPGRRMYHTGDLAVWTAEGRLRCLGRVDGQVKLRGHRIELGEVEARIEDLEGVREAVVLLREDVPGDPRLVAYVVGRTDGVREELRAGLPEIMVPSALVALDELPRTANRKVDRAALPAPVLATTVGAAPTTDAERAVARIWSELLPVALDDLSVQDDFFALGGHSLLAARLTSRLSEASGTRVELRTVFEHSRLGDLAAATQSGHGPAAGPVPVAREGRRLLVGDLDRHDRLVACLAGRSDQVGGDLLVWPMSTAQQRMWLLHELAPTDPSYHVSVLRKVCGTLSPDRLEDAVLTLVARYELLRTTYRQFDDLLVQVVHEPDAMAPLVRRLDLRGQTWDDVLAEMRRESHVPFDLVDGPVLRVTLAQVGADEWLVLLVQHHIAIDGWSLSGLLDDLWALYDGRDLPEVALQFGDYAVWEQERDRSGADADYWRTTLHDAPAESTFPGSVEPAPDSTPVGRRVRRRLGPDAVRAVNDLAHARGATPFMVLAAAVSGLMARHGAGPDVVIGAPVATRSFAGAEELSGPLINTLALRLSADPGRGFGDHVAGVAEVCRSAYAHADHPFERLVSELDLARSPGRHPLFQVLVSLQEEPPVRTGPAGVVVEPVEIDWHAARVDATFAWTLGTDHLDLVLEYRSDRFDDDVMGGWLADRFERFLTAALADADAPTGTLACLGDDERRTIESWSAPVPTVVRPLLPDLVREVAARAPDRRAVELRGDSLTFSELVAAADVLAGRLSAVGVRPGDMVALLVGHDLAWPVAALAAWRLGAAWVPVDPTYPPIRQQLMIEDSASVAVVVPAGVEPPTAVGSLPVVVCDPEADATSGAHMLPPHADSPDDAAYLIYTSGSTGRPKAARISHRNVAAFTDAVRERIYDGRDEVDLRVGLLAAVVFDFSVFQLLHLGFGSTLVLVPDDVRRDPPGLVAFARDAGLDVLDVTPTHLRTLADEGLLDQARFAHLLVGGEAIDQDLWDRLRTRAVPALNIYGPTECTVCATTAEVLGAPVPVLGRPLPGMRVRVVDAEGRVRPVGVPGELLLGGDQVGDGYVGRPELTAERFPASADGRWYRTGDLVAARASGELVFLGRIDDQVKIRGFRIEPGEVAEALRRHPDVGEAVVLAEDGQLVAYVTVPFGRTCDPAALRHDLRQELPSYLVPATIVATAAIPLTAGGKVDRAALRMLPRDTVESTAPTWRTTGRAPRGPAEELVAEIWSDLLGASEVYADDDFFDLGGDSLSASRFVARLRTLDIDLPLVSVFSHPRLSEVARPITDLLLAQVGEPGPDEST